jgi:hypothetical protein
MEHVENKIAGLRTAKSEGIISIVQSNLLQLTRLALGNAGMTGPRGCASMCQATLLLPGN